MGEILDYNTKTDTPPMSSIALATSRRTGRFPLYARVGLLSLALLLGGLVFAILYLTARREQAFLESAFVADYAAYAARVPMFFPKPWLFATESAVTFSPRAIERNLLDALVFLSAIPLADVARMLHSRVDLLGICLP